VPENSLCPAQPPQQNPGARNTADASATEVSGAAAEEQIGEERKKMKKRRNRSARGGCRSQNQKVGLGNEFLLDIFLTGTVEIRNFLFRSHANKLYDTFFELLPFSSYHHKTRSTVWYGPVNYCYSKVKVIPSGDIDSNRDIRRLKERLNRDLKCNFNSCLVNLYKNEKDSIGPHADDEDIFGDNPTIASISLGCTRRFLIEPFPVEHRNRNKDQTMFSRSCFTRFEIPLKHGELLVMRGDMQKYWRHSVPEESYPCGPRVNLTFREVKYD
jgi:alkylated DNA repair dioxygenase AlkB